MLFQVLAFFLFLVVFNTYLDMSSSYHGHRDNGDYGDGGDTNLTSSGPRSVTPRAPTNPLASSSTSRPASRPNPAAVNTPTPIHHAGPNIADLVSNRPMSQPTYNRSPAYSSRRRRSRSRSSIIDRSSFYSDEPVKLCSMFLLATSINLSSLLGINCPTLCLEPSTLYSNRRWPRHNTNIPNKWIRRLTYNRYCTKLSQSRSPCI